MKPLVFDLFCGLGGFSKPFIEQGYRAVGFDIEAHDYGQGGYPGELILRDIRSLNGANLVKEFGSPACIVASPPCQEFSYMAMPWSKAKEKMRKIADCPAEQTRLTDLFHQCFRIQREVSQAAGYYVPMVVENVRGAQRWVGKARWNFGSFYLWGDVPALMPIPITARMKSKISCSPRRFDERIASTPEEAAALHYRLPKGEGNKTSGMNWSDQKKRGQDFTRIAAMQAESDGIKQPGIGGLRDNGKGDARFKNGAARSGSKSNARKRASAEIAKIPPVLAHWLAKIFKPQHETPK